MILVTGATGFLGKRVCKKLAERGLEFEKTSLSLGVDLRNASQVDRLFERLRPEYVLHCAAFVGGIQFGLAHTAEIFQNNLLMTVHLLEACRNYGVKRLVNPISNCAYPGRARLFREDEFWDGPLHDSVLVYGMVRKMSFVGSTAYRMQYGLDSINLILSNMYGPEDHFDEARSHALGALIMKFSEAKDKGLPSVCVWGTGQPVREWLHVDDGAEAMIRAMWCESCPDPVNIGVAKGISISGMAEMIQRCIGYEGEIQFDTTKPDGAPYKTVDGSRGQKLLGWSPEIPFERGVEETVAWYQNHKKGREAS